MAMPLSEAKLALASHARPRIYEFVHPMQGKVRIPAHIAPLLNVFEQQTARRRARSSYKCFLTTLDQSACTPITGEYKNAAAYRHQFIRAQTSDREQRGCPRRSRKDIAFTLGVDVRSVKSTLDRAGVKSEMQFEDVLISAYTSAADLNHQIDQIIREKQGFPRTWVKKLPSGDVEHVYNPINAAKEVELAFKLGTPIYLRLQVASKRTLMSYMYAAQKPSRTLKLALAKHIALPDETLEYILGKPKRIADGERYSKGRYYGRDFNPRWVQGQLLLRLELEHGWQPRNEKLLNPVTGELAGRHMSVEELTEVIRLNYGYTVKFDASFLNSVFGDI